MDVDLYINGVWREVAVLSLSVHEGLNGRSTMRCRVQTAAVDVPELDDAVVLEMNSGSPSDVLFAGVISDVDEQWLDPDGNRITSITSEDYTALADRRFINASTTGGISGRDAIDYVVTNYLAAYGVTRDPSMAAGATLGALAYDYARATDVINDIVRLAAPDGWLWRIDENKVLTAWEPSAVAYPCPWSLTSPSQLAGNLAIKPSRERYANRVVLSYNDGTATPAEVVASDAAEIAARGIFEMVFKASGPLDATTAQAIADAYLVQLLVRPRTITFPTVVQGARAGQILAVNLPDDSLVGDFLITELEMVDLDGVDLTYRITAVEGAVKTASWKDTFRQWSGNGASSGVASVGTVIITVPTPAPSVTQLGGSTSRSVVPGAGSWLAVDDAAPYVAPQTRSVTLRCVLRARDAGVTVTARLRDLTAGATVATTSGVTGTTATLVSASGTVTAGNRYELQVSADTANAGAYCIGTLEVA